MDLRAELLPPPVSRQRPAELSRGIDRIADLVADPALDLAEYGGSRSVREFAVEAAGPPCGRVADIGAAALKYRPIAL
ncbi:hypothetical protein ACIP98_42140 [Streptomyces sp. NPDC088354]|uniref:hypothetical protein n=1 Tax=Streptomyces sp. NPDC088354 TaxID=3365856 RepID=UPI003813B974